MSRESLYACDCRIIMRTGETLDSSMGDRPCSDVSRIELCAHHARVKFLETALRRFHREFNNRGETSSLHDWNERMKNADVMARVALGDLKVPYPEFCRTPQRCEGLGCCPSDPCCID